MEKKLTGKPTSFCIAKTDDLFIFLRNKQSQRSQNFFDYFYIEVINQR
jgi:hypothetical protein